MRTTSPVRVRRIRVAGLLLAVAAGTLGYQAFADEPLTASSSRVASSLTATTRSAAAKVGLPRLVPAPASGVADGAIPDDTTVFDDVVPGVARLDPALLAALRRAAGDADAAGVQFVVNSGWRSPAYEDRLRREAVEKYGSVEEAARWVATGTTSPHVSGAAVDLGPIGSTPWLSEHGAAYGLCQIYGNEPWHYELRPEAVEHGCPAMYPDPTHDPRMQP